MGYLFISFTQSNFGYAHKLADKLLADGFDVWLADGIDYGDERFAVSAEAIQQASACAVIMTSQSKASRWVRHEVLLATELHKPIFSILREGENWPLFRALPIVDVRDGSLPDDEFTARLNAVVRRGRASGTRYMPPPFDLDC